MKIMRPPAGVTSISIAGSEHVIRADGTLLIGDDEATELVAHGFTEEPAPPEFLPLSQMTHGQMTMRAAAEFASRLNTMSEEEIRELLGKTDTPPEPGAVGVAAMSRTALFAEARVRGLTATPAMKNEELRTMLGHVLPTEPVAEAKGSMPAPPLAESAA